MLDRLTLHISIAIEIVKLHIVRSIKRHVRNVPPNYTMRNYSKSLHQMKIVPSACCLYHQFIQGINTEPAVGKGYAVDAFMQLQNEMAVSVFVPFAELQHQLLQRR